MLKLRLVGSPVFFTIALFLSGISTQVYAAQTAGKTEAVEQTFAQLSQPGQEAQAADDDVTYRQRLKEVISTSPEKQLGLAADTYIRYMPSRSLKAQPGKMSVLDTSTEISYSFKAFDKLPIELSIDGGYIALMDKQEMPLSLPAKLTSMGFGAQTTLPCFFDKTYLRLKVEPTFNSEDWNMNSTSLHIASQAFVIYQPSEKWTFVLGVGANPGYETAIFPIGGFIYKPNEKLEFNIIPARPTITYDLTDRLSVFLEGGLSGGEYKVNKDGYKTATLNYNEIHGGAGLALKVSKNINASLSAGRMFNRYLEYRDSLGKVNIKNDYYSEFRIEASI